MEIRAEEISQIIRDQIKDYEKKVEVTETGTVLSVGDGVARVYGVENAMAMEMLEFPGNIFGVCLNLEEDNVGVAIMGDDTAIKEGLVHRLEAGVDNHRFNREVAKSSYCFTKTEGAINSRAICRLCAPMAARWCRFSCEKSASRAASSSGSSGAKR